MKTPEGLAAAVDFGIIQEVVRPLMSGKEAQIYVVVVEGTQCAAKVYKEATHRTFKHRSEYTEGRRTRNSRDQRAVEKRTRHGRKQDEAHWRNTEVDMIYRLRDAGVRVPEPLNFVDGVLVMELVVDAHGDPAPRLGDLEFSAGEAREIHQQLLGQVVRMLAAGVIHGDLSEFNVLMAADGPVLIDFPQALDAARNQNARRILLRDVENLHRFLERHAPGSPAPPYAQEMWSLYEAGRLRPDTELRGSYRAPRGKANTEEVLGLIEDAERDRRRRGRDSDDRDEHDDRAGHDDRDERDGSPVAAGPKPLRRVVDLTQEAGPRSAGRRGTRRPRKPGATGASLPASSKGSAGSKSRSAPTRGTEADRPGRQDRANRPAAAGAASTEPPRGAGEAEPQRKRRNRRRRKRPTSPGGDAGASTVQATPRTKGGTAAGSESTGDAEPGRPRRRRRRRPARSSKPRVPPGRRSDDSAAAGRKEALRDAALRRVD